MEQKTLYRAAGVMLILAWTVATFRTGGFSLRGEPEVETLRGGETVRRTLTRDDLQPRENGRYRAFRFRAAARRTYVFTMRSDDFEPFLVVTEGSIEAHHTRSSNRGGSPETRVRFTPLDSGIYVLAAQSFRPEGTGEFTLRMDSVPGTPPPPAPARPLRMGDTVRGALERTDTVSPVGARYDLYVLRGRPGDQMVVDYRADAFEGGLEEDFDDPEAIPPSELPVLLPTRIRQRYTLGPGGEQRVRVASIRGATGAYTLAISDGREAGMPMPAPIRPGTRVHGSITDDDAKTEEGQRYDLYSFRARAGEAVSIELTSYGFGAVVALWRFDEDGALLDMRAAEGVCIPSVEDRLECVLPATGEYVVRAMSWFPDGRGDYTLRVQLGPAAKT